MPEIKIEQSTVEPVFNDLKSRTNELDTVKPNLEFNESKLDFIQKIEEIEATYYETINQYKTLLIKAESDAWSSVSSFIQCEENIANDIKKGPVR
ncbi:YwqI/YxiC family protein [Pseudalkalibacillus decolorationis]|uniref:YwqI/YxiC family protein n=1 Tax=Pseudalkalibacillus decolorationis TaxID=163879 RepID=UPI002147321B|nr:YwqI/YxiC family protein [Pseudalkalibacillus decolorationis]